MISHIRSAHASKLYSAFSDSSSGSGESLRSIKLIIEQSRIVNSKSIVYAKLGKTR